MKIKMLMAQIAVAAVVSVGVSYGTGRYIIHQQEQEFWCEKRIEAREKLVAEYDALMQASTKTPKEASDMLFDHWWTVHSLTNVFEGRIESEAIAYKSVLQLMKDRADDGEAYWTDVYFTPIFTYLDMEMKRQIGS